MPRLPTPLTLPDHGHEHNEHTDSTTNGNGARAAASGAPGKRPRPGAARRWLRGETATAWAFVSPSVLIILGLSVIPVAWSLLLSFQADDLVTPSRWVGLGNYQALVRDPHFSQAVRNTLLYTVLY
ncbi:carbohydrate ABC transporter permease, partial [Streptomyces sp. NPDC056730]